MLQAPLTAVRPPTQYDPAGQTVHSPAAARFVRDEYVPSGHSNMAGTVDPAGQ